MVRLVLILILLCLALAACDSSPTINSTATSFSTFAPTKQPLTTSPPVPTFTPLITKQTSTAPAWEYLWLQGNPCFAPCWLGITPGQTHLDDAVKILKQNSFVKTESVKVENDRISWSWREGYYEGQAIYDPKSKDHIIISMGAAGYEAQFKLGEIIKVYGEPEYTRASNTGGIPSIYFYWFLKGFSLGMNGNQFETPPVINPDLFLGKSTGGLRLFSERTIQKFTINAGPDFEINRFVPWQGYKDFSFYCRNRGQELACRY